MKRLSIGLAGLACACASTTPDDNAREIRSAALASPPLITSAALSPASIARPPSGGVLFAALKLGFADLDGDARGLEVTRTPPDGAARVIAVRDGWRLGVTGGGGSATYPIAIHPMDAVGRHRVDVVVVDRAGQRSKASTVYLDVVQGAAALAITGFDPTQAAPGTKLTLVGRGFDPAAKANTVTVGDARAEVVTASPTQLTVIVPASATSGAVGVSNPRGAVTAPTAISIDRRLQIITPNLRSIDAGGHARFTARFAGLRPGPITWSVNGVPGGTATVGRIDASGDYAAPVTVPEPAQVTIGASAGSGTQTTTATVTINLSAPCAEPGTATVQPGGVTVVDTSGTFRLVVLPGAIAPATSVTLTSGGAAPAPASDRVLRRFTATSDRAVDLATAGRVSIALPSWRAPGKLLRLHRAGAATPTTVTVDASGVRAEGPLARLGDYALAEGVADAPSWNKLAMKATALRVPADLDLDVGPTNLVKEGATLPVLVEGSQLGGGQLEVVVAGATIVGASSSRPATAAELAALTVSAATVSSTSTQLGFTFRSSAIPTLGAGEQMQVGFSLRRFAGAGTPAEIVDLPRTWLVVLGLPELIVAPKPVAAQDLFAADGTPIDALVSETGCQAIARCAIGTAGCTFPATGCYSEIYVRPAATLGIGKALTTAYLPRPDGAVVPTDLSDLAKVQARFGKLSWADGKPANAKLFVPFRDHVEIDVAGSVRIMGQIYLAGVRGGENQELRPDPTVPDQSEQARRAGLGGLVASLAGDVFVSGGMGGDGGVTTGSGESVTAGDGNPAGNSIPDAGKGRLPDGLPLDQSPPAPGGHGLRHADLPMFGFLNAIAENAGTIQGLLTVTQLPATDRFLHLLGGAEHTDYGPTATQLDFVETGSQAYGELNSTNGQVAGVGKSLFTPNASSYGGPGPDYYGGRGGLGGARRAALDGRLEVERQIQTGAGGGGGGGGGASTEVTAAPHVVPAAALFAFHDDRVGGGGGGGGGAAGSARITAGERIVVGISGAVIATGGRGGYGQRHVLFAGPGGGGGGGTGGNLKLQAPVIINDARIDASGGASGGAILGMSGSPLPECSLQLQMLDGRFSGGFLTYITGESQLAMVYPTGRVRSRIVTGAPIAGVGVAVDAAGAPDGSLWVVEPSPSMRLWRTQPVNYNDGFVPPRSPTEWAQDLGTAVATASPALTVVDVAQDPRAPYHVFVAGYAPVGAAMHAKLLELDAQGTYLREAFSTPAMNDAHGLRYLANLDFGSDGAMYLGLAPPSGVSGVFRLDRATGSLVKVRGNLDGYDGISVLRAASIDGAKDQLAMSFCRPEGLAGDNTPPIYNARLFRFTVDGDEVAQVTIGIESLGGPGQAGLVRVDGLAECSELPILEENGDPIAGYDASTYLGPTVGSLGTAQVLDLEQRVTRARTLALKIGGAGPLHRAGAPSPEPFDVRVVHETGAVGLYPDLLATYLGTLTYPVALQPGFSAIFTQAHVGGETPTLLKRHVLALP